MAKKDQTTELVEQQGGDVVLAERPAWLKEGSKRGSENVTHTDLVIPRLEVVQALSPARKKDHADYIEGAEEGMLFNSVTRELYGHAVQVVPCFYLKEWLVWKDRKKGGGFRGAHPTEAAAKDFISKMIGDDKPEDFDAMDTAQHFCLLLKPDGKVQQIVLSMSRSKMKVSRKWNSLISLTDDDSFAKAYKVEAISEKNKNNEDYFNFKISPAGYVRENVYNAGQAMYELLKAGGARADTSGMDTEEGGSKPSTADTEF